MDPFAALCCGANASHCADDADLPVQHQDHFDDNANVDAFPKCTAPQSIEPRLSLARRHIDFEGNNLDFTIHYPKNSQALTAEVQIGSATISDLKEIKKSAHGHIGLVVRAILDRSMTGPVCACVQYLDAEKILHHSRLTAEVKVLARQNINMELKGKINLSASSLQLHKKQQSWIPRSFTVEELKNSQRYREYADKLKMDGIFVKPRPADNNANNGNANTKSYCIVPRVQIWPDVYDFDSPVKKSTSNGLLVSHLNGVPVSRHSKSLNGSPAHDCHSEILFACESYKMPPSSVDSEGQSKPVPVVTILPKQVIRRTRSEERLSSACSGNAAYEKLSLKERINVNRSDLLEHLSERTQEWFCYTQRLWFRTKREYRIVSDGIQRMNRENR